MMTKLGRWAGPAVGRSLLLLTLALAAGSASAREVTVTGSKMNRFGRIQLQFDLTTKVSVRIANSVLVITFAEPAKVMVEKLATELAPYVTTVRRDPDGTGLRLALAAPVRPNLLEAAERVFIDLLPSNWTGLPPGLPPEVVAELAARVQEAEAKLKAAVPRPAEPPKTLRLRLGELPALTRFAFEMPPDLPVQVKETGDEIQLAFEGPLTFDAGGGKPKLAAGVAGYDATRDAKGVTIRVKRAPGFVSQVFRETDGIVLDIAKPQLPQVLPEPAPKVAPPPPAVSRANAPDTAQSAGASAPAPSAAKASAPASVPRDVSAPRPPSKVVAQVESGPDGSSVLFPFSGRTPAAAYRRAGLVTLLFETRDDLDAHALATASDKTLRPVEVRSENGVVTLRLPDPPSGAIRLLPEGEGWRLSTGNAAGLPADALRISRGFDDHGRPLVRVGLWDASRAHWLREPDGARLAVVTASGRVQGLPLERSFVEFTLVPSLHGVVVEGHADDLSVSLGQSGAEIGRSLGLSLSPAGRGFGERGTAGRLVLTREAWMNDVGPGAFDRYAALVWETASASAAGRAEARFRLARFMIANGMNHEALSLLSLARSEDSVFAKRRDALVLSGIAAARARRPAEARALLSAEGTAEDPEAVLWRAVADAVAERWDPALAGFRRSTEVTELYPDELAGPIRLLGLKAALASGDVTRAEGELGAIDRMASGVIAGEQHDLARARVDEVAGRPESALKAYHRLMSEADHPVAAEATLRGIRLGFKEKAISVDDAIERLEALAVTWRGGDIEVGAVTDLARLYGQAKRWREMFAMTRRANRYFPNHPATRALQEDSAQLLEALLLGRDGEKLPAVQALALYYDFKEFAPVGRRGDAILRRLADRLVELDLLDQAADLLQYQVDNRLSGAARATVAARLAAIRLISGKPILALSALHSTRLSELPEEVRRFRYMLEARAQADLSRADLALEILDGETGADFDRLRASIYWNARRWREAGEAGEALLGTRWEGAEALSDRDRADLLRAAIAYALADERIALDRLKGKFARKMMDSPDARTFELILRPNAAETRDFRLAAQDVMKADNLRSLLSDWRGHPLDTTPEPERDETAAERPAAPRVDGAAAPAPARG